MNGEYKIGETVLGNWTLVKLLGEGAYGKVYEAHREDFGTTYKAAVKIMSIPQSQSEVESARAEGYDDDSVTAYFRSFVEEVVQEFALMSRLKGMTNIVSCEDFQVEPHTDELGWDILIRMELLTPMLNYMSSHQMTRSDVIKLGVDMCHALELCQRYNIIHRDIKPENIFISDSGDYKLGDFGVARTLEKTTGGLSKKGTYTYMAPEIYKDEKYGSSVDIYSLGIVLYRLLNNNRAPFLPEPPKPITHSERERGLVRRISGEPLPPPANADGRLAEIVLKACAYEPKDRYSSPLQMRQELEAIQYNRAEDAAIYGKAGQIDVDSGAYTKNRRDDEDEATVYERRDSAPVKDKTPGPDDEKTVYEEKRREESDAVKTAPEPPSKKKAGRIAVIAAAAVALLVLAFVLLPKVAKKPDGSPAEASSKETASSMLESLVRPEGPVLLNEYWPGGSLLIVAKDSRSAYVELTDNRIPDGYTISETKGTLEPFWCVSFHFDTKNENLTEVCFNEGADLQHLYSFVRSIIGGEEIYSSIEGYRLDGNTLSFELSFHSRVPYGLADVQRISLGTGTESKLVTDNYEYTPNLLPQEAPEPSPAPTLASGSDWHSLALEPEGSELQLLSCRYLGGPDVERVEFSYMGGDDACLYVYYPENSDVVLLFGGAWYDGEIQASDIVRDHASAKKDLEFLSLPSRAENPLLRMITNINVAGMNKYDKSDLLILFAADSSGEIVSTFIFEIGYFAFEPEKAGESYTITFNANGGFFDAAQTVAVQQMSLPAGRALTGSILPYPEHPDRTKTLDTWYLDPDCKTPASSGPEGIVPTGDLTLYAGYIDCIRFTLISNGGFFGASSTQKDVTWRADSDFYCDSWTDDLSHSDPDMVFTGWYRDEACTQFVCGPGGSCHITEPSLVLYAGWAKNG